KWRENIKNKVRSAADYIAWLESTFSITEEQRKAILAPFDEAPAAGEQAQQQDGGAPTYATVSHDLHNAKTADEFAAARDLIRGVEDTEHRAELEAIAKKLETG